MKTRALRRVLGALALPGAIVCAIGAGCEPQDIYLFDEASEEPSEQPEAREPDAGREEPEPEPPPAGYPDDAEPVQPACDTPECEQCVSDGLCRPESATLLCHPVTAACKVPCDPEAPPEERTCPSDERCDARGLCVDCVEDDDCGGPTPVCDGARNECVQCVSSYDCSGERSFCDQRVSRCVECLGDDDCVSGEVCLLGPGPQRCVQCRDDADCRALDEQNRCLPDVLICVECVDDDDCSDPDKPFCKLSEHECDDERE